MTGLQKQLDDRDIRNFDAKDSRIMCFAHVVDLCAGRVIQGLTKRERDPVAVAQSAVAAIRGSGVRRELFDKLISTGNALRIFDVENPTESSKAGQLPDLELLRNVPTRWDSTYQMLHRLRQMRPVCHFNLIGFSSHKSTKQVVEQFFAHRQNADITRYCILPEDWAVMRDVELVLGVSYQANLNDTLSTPTHRDLTSGLSRRTAHHVKRKYSNLIRHCPSIRDVYVAVGKIQQATTTEGDHQTWP